MYAYVRIKDKWVRGVCKKYLHLARMSERDRKLYSDTERQRKRIFTQGFRDRALAGLYPFLIFEKKTEGSVS
jgi:hypothetical protein